MAGFYQNELGMVVNLDRGERVMVRCSPTPTSDLKPHQTTWVLWQQLRKSLEEDERRLKWIADGHYKRWNFFNGRRRATTDLIKQGDLVYG